MYDVFISLHSYKYAVVLFAVCLRSRMRARVHQMYVHVRCACGCVLGERAALCGVVKQRQPCKSVLECGSPDRFSPLPLPFNPFTATPAVPPSTSVDEQSLIMRSSRTRWPSWLRLHQFRDTAQPQRHAFIDDIAEVAVEKTRLSAFCGSNLS